jgi:hypothetical protein
MKLSFSFDEISSESSLNQAEVVKLAKPLQSSGESLPCNCNVDFHALGFMISTLKSFRYTNMSFACLFNKDFPRI